MLWEYLVINIYAWSLEEKSRIKDGAIHLGDRSIRIIVEAMNVDEITDERVHNKSIM